ncbi:hypothetical protein ASG87_03140 [Frateuria sp. Soil773]|uniref:hypothetical protein n=1 Tax=Frateuria sp. Soil773 TaxID=1736407 RepID=UPI0006F78303|nr:hypothetical protein [Frateuria sp. Soil773]KRE89350.1 hypothetical protein ASG87_03140 [Frateuria sp. Soil773]
MTAEWKTLYEGTVDGRRLVLRRSGEGSYKLLTEQSTHDEGIAYQDGATYVHVSPSGAGEAVESEVTSGEGLAEALKELHFTPLAIATVLDAAGLR